MILQVFPKPMLSSLSLAEIWSISSIYIYPLVLVCYLKSQFCCLKFPTSGFLLWNPVVVEPQILLAKYETLVRRNTVSRISVSQWRDIWRRNLTKRGVLRPARWPPFVLVERCSRYLVESNGTDPEISWNDRFIMVYPPMPAWSWEFTRKVDLVNVWISLMGKLVSKGGNCSIYVGYT